jgi:hypothetical protein
MHLAYLFLQLEVISVVVELVGQCQAHWTLVIVLELLVVILLRRNLLLRLLLSLVEELSVFFRLPLRLLTLLFFLSLLLC